MSALTLSMNVHIIFGTLESLQLPRIGDLGEGIGVLEYSFRATFARTVLGQAGIKANERHSGAGLEYVRRVERGQPGKSRSICGP
jgi:hypothetical protein